MLKELHHQTDNSWPLLSIMSNAFRVGEGLSLVGQKTCFSVLDYSNYLVFFGFPTAASTTRML
jgi:hypothetical protein